MMKKIKAAMEQYQNYLKQQKSFIEEGERYRKEMLHLN
jgi:hypothetical protein